MRDEDWEVFFDLVDKIVQDGRPWKEKAAELNHRNERQGSSSLGELASWVDDDDEIYTGN